MKKKMVCMLLVLCMAVGLCACGEPKEEKETVVEAVDTTKEENDSDTVAEENRSDSQDWLTSVYTNRYYGYSLMCPKTYNKVSGFGVEYWLDGVTDGEKLHITQYSGDKSERQLETIDIAAYQSSEDIFEVLLPNYENDALLNGFEVVDYEVEIIETSVVNDCDTTKFQGQIEITYASANDGITWVCPVVAYGIATEKTPVLISCLDFSALSNGEVESTHEEWITKIDDIVATFEE